MIRGADLTARVRAAHTAQRFLSALWHNTAQETEVRPMWITKRGALAACILSMCGCAHGRSTAEPAAPATAETLREHAASAIRELEPTGIAAFDEYVETLQSSGDPIDAVAASLLADLVAHVQRSEEMRGPIVVTFGDPRTPTLRMLTDTIEVGLRKHPTFRISDRHAYDAVGEEQRREYGGRFDDNSVQSVGAHLGAHAFGRVAVERTDTRSVISVRITSMRTLLVIADARMATDTPLPADATTDAMRKALLTAREVRRLMTTDTKTGASCIAPDGRELPSICCKDPSLQACQ